jgi:hypothetical protein
MTGDGNPVRYEVDHGHKQVQVLQQSAEVAGHANVY